MHVILFILTVFFYGGKTPEVFAFSVTSPELCTVEGPKIREKILNRADVRDAKFACIEVTGKDKT